MLGQLPNAKIRVGNTDMLVSKNANICVTPDGKTKMQKMQNPKASQCNIGCVGSPKQNSCIGDVNFMLFILVFFSSWVPSANAVPSAIWGSHFYVQR